MVPPLARIAAITCLTIAIVVAPVAIADISIMSAMAPIVPAAVTIVVHSLFMVSRSRTTMTCRSPEIAIPVSEIPVIMAVVDVVVVVVTQARSPVEMVIVVMMSVIRVAPKTVVIDMQVVG